MLVVAAEKGSAGAALIGSGTARLKGETGSVSLVRTCSPSDGSAKSVSTVSPPSFEIRARFIATEPGMPAPPGPNERFDDTDRGEDARTAPSAERGEVPLLSNGLTERRRGVGPDSCAGDPRLCRGELALKAAALLCMPSFERLSQRARQSSGSRQ